MNLIENCGHLRERLDTQRETRHTAVLWWSPTPGMMRAHVRQCTLKHSQIEQWPALAERVLWAVRLVPLHEIHER
jgi:hypothetical protein